MLNQRHWASNADKSTVIIQCVKQTLSMEIVIMMMNEMQKLVNWNYYNLLYYSYIILWLFLRIWACISSFK